MKYCSNCGNKVEQSSNFCEKCGSELRTINESANESNDKHRYRTFSVWAAIFSIFYYGKKKMWAKGFVLMSLVYIILIITTLINPDWVVLVATITSVLIFGIMSPIDVKRYNEKKETMWPELPSFLRSKVVVGILFTTLLLSYITVLFYNPSESSIEESSVSVVTEIVQDQWGLDVECERVIITKDLGNNNYEAKAEMDTGEVLDITIEYYPKKDTIYVEIPYQ
ncbi:MAG TPA: zinc ribbon domain-containing protein [Bavariicoccus seileri]|uniref:Zinc ribbon domain-containing protein n=1 Tax=Bavariicoccus seileri TaxID=549685 RepID=A0A3D4S566_9ENTE|nr:zinc ribbon domain-containing protein [Bavariicoccus seileri]HCS93947.1 zinc ribbon domain-containing protein [Bavariicoccus seileri]